MNRIIVTLTLYTLTVMNMGVQIYAQRPPDSLFQKVVIFKKPAYGNKVDSLSKAYFREAGYPQATGFYIKPDSVGQLYIATAKHVFHRNDSIQTITIAWKSLLNKGDFWSSHLFLKNNVGLYDQDSLVDMVLVYNCLPPAAAHYLPKVYAFHPDEIMTKEEFFSVKPGQKLFYIGMYPDSISSEVTYFLNPTGQLKEIDTIPRIAKDMRSNLRFSYDFKLYIVGEPGISGSPVIMKAGNSYKVFGIINGSLNDSIQSAQTKNIIGTAAYRILDVLRSNSLY